MNMGLVDTPPPPGLAAVPDARTVCRCGHCRAVIDVPDGRRLRCPSCGWLNAIPRRVHVACERCHHSQRVRFSQRNRQILCMNCGHALYIREVELTPTRRHTLQGASSRRHGSRRESVVLIILLYALVLLFFLLWFSRR